MYGPQEALESDSGVLACHPNVRSKPGAESHCPMNFDVRSRTVFVQPESQSAVMLEIGRLTRSIHIATPLRVSLWFSRALDDTDVEEEGGGG